MKGKMFGHRIKKTQDSERVPGEPWNGMGGDYGRGTEDEEEYKYPKSKDVKEGGFPQGKAKDSPPGYEGKEHVKYKNPGFAKHHIRFPEDEPHMKSHVSQDESHEMEDDFHMGVPNQTEYSLESKLKRARMKMDAPDQEDPDYLRGNMITKVPGEGEEDTSGEEEMGPNEMQSSKEHRKKMIVAVARRRMKKKMPMHSR